MKKKTQLFLFFVLSMVLSCQSNKESSQPPNVLFILADDLGYHDLSCMGSPYYETPHIDRLAKEGMTFTNGYATCQVCSPSRASIMTGKFPARLGITDWIGARTGEDWRKAGRHNQLLPPDYVHALPQEDNTLPEAMKTAGYKTFFAGKWHLGSEGSWPTDHGFDTNKGGWDKGSPIGGYFSPWDNPNLPNQKVGENLSMRLAEETASFIEEHRDTNFFAFLSFYAVHGPIQTTQEKWRKYRDKAAEMGIAESGFEMGHFLPIRQVQDNPVYAGLVEAMDDAVGVVLDKLDELGLAENTIVIFTSDNGGVAAGDAFATSNLPLRAGKGYQFEGGIREPYFVKVPGITKGGEKSDVPVTGTDFYPTLLELIGQPLKPEEHQDGMSLLPLLKGDSIPTRPLIWHYPHYGNQGGEPSSIIREGDWKLIHYYEDGRKELYNLVDDLEEQTDVAEDHPEIVHALDKKLFNYLEEVGARYPVKDPEYDAALEQQYLEKVRMERWPRLEAQRLRFLSEDYDPGNNWWGSALEPAPIINGLALEDLGKSYDRNPAVVPDYLYFANSNTGGTTSVRRNDGPNLKWKTKGYYQRNRELGQTFYIPKDSSIQMDAIVLRTGNSAKAILSGAAGAEMHLQLFEVIGEPAINDNGTPTGSKSKHGFSTNHRCDDYLDGITYKTLANITGGTFPDIPPTTKNGGEPGHLRYIRWDLQGDAELILQGGKRYAFMVGFNSNGPEKGFSIGNDNHAADPAPPKLRTDANGVPWWSMRREGDGTLPPTKYPGENPPDDPNLVKQLIRESLFYHGFEYDLPPSTNGFPDVDTYRTVEFYIEVKR